MAFVNFSLIAGSLLVTIPIVLHLVMRQQPKQMIFPALQFLRQRRETNQRKLQLRHWLLLLLRCLAVLVAALALAGPSVASAKVGVWVIIVTLVGLLLMIAGTLVISVVQKRSRTIILALAGTAALIGIVLVVLFFMATSGNADVMIGDQRAPVAAVIVVDTSPGMEYQHRNSTALANAKDTALWLIRQLPIGSDVAVLSSRQEPAVFSIDLAAAKKSVERLEVTTVPRTLPDALASAIKLASSSKQQRHEIYIFTDQSRRSWQSETVDDSVKRLAAERTTQIYVVDVGAPKPTNFALGEISLSAQRLSQNGRLQIDVPVSNVGGDNERTIELYLEKFEPTLPVIRDDEIFLPESVRRGGQVAQFSADASTAVSFQLQGLEVGTHHGFARIVEPDGLAIDNMRHFTISVHEAWPVLVLKPQGGTERFFVEAISPFEHRETGQARFDCTVAELTDLPNRTLSAFAAVCLLDPTPITPDVWLQLYDYVAQGGSLLICLGHNAASRESFHSEEAQQVMPGTIARQWRASERELFLAPRTFDHPILAEFRSQATSIPWHRFPVFKHWQLKPLAADARVIIPFNQSQPAVVERPVGKGRVLTFTTPISDTIRPDGRTTWNELPTGENAWPYVVLINETMRYLLESNAARLNYSCGETAALNVSPQRDPKRFQLFTPDDEPQEVTARGDRLSVRFTERVGAYRLKGNQGGPVLRGFSVNLPEDSTDLTRATKEELDRILGKDVYRYASDREEIEVGVGESRVGYEFYPFLLVVLVVTLGLEHLLANRFYRKKK